MSAGRIIVIKRPVLKGAHHGGGWKIAYADFMTAMMAFFLVMWLLAISTPKQLAGIAEHFKAPLKISLAGGPAASLSSSVIPGGGGDPIQKTGEISTQLDPAADASDSTRLSALKQRLDELIESSPLLRQYRPQLLIDITAEGLRIQIVDSNNRPMFERSSAVVVQPLQAILREIGPVLNAQPHKITLSGHTDATLYAQGERAYSNWELSADRANASRRELVAGGMQDAKVLRVMGVAASIHLDPTNPQAAINRRITIVVLNKRTQADIEAANAAPAAGVLPAPPPVTVPDAQPNTQPNTQPNSQPNAPQQALPAPQDKASPT